MKKELRNFLPLLAVAVAVIAFAAIVINSQSGSMEKVKSDLTFATEQLNKAREIKTKDPKIISQLLKDYATNISRALETAKKIKDSNVAKEALTLIFKRVASHQAILRAIGWRAADEFQKTVDRTGDANIKVQEQAAEELLAFAEKPPSDSSDKKSNTAQALSCKECNVIIVSLTTLRKDHMGIYGYDRKTTPNIDEFFKNSLLFNNTTSPASWTTPSLVSFFTSLFPYRHGIMIRDPHLVYNRKILTLAEILKKGGYRTAAFTGGGDYNSRYNGLNRGFDFYLDEYNFYKFGINGDHNLGVGTLLYAPLRSFLKLGTEWLANNSNSKFFLLLQGYDAHCPLEPRQPFAGQFTKGLQSNLDFSYCYWTHEDSEPLYENGKKYWMVKIRNSPSDENGAFKEVKFFQSDLDYMIALYDARIAEMDFYLNDLFKKIKTLGLEKNTIVILMAEHGEMLGEHGRFMRGGTTKGSFYEPALNFPLLIKHPKIKEPIVINDLVQTVDLMPTIFQMLGLEDPQRVIRDGNALQFSAFKDEPTNKYNFAGSLYAPLASNPFFNRPTASEAIRDEKFKLLKETLFGESGLEPASVSYKLFDLQNDPKEEKNLYGINAGEAEKLKNELEKWLNDFNL